VIEHQTAAEQLSRWRRDFHHKPGPTRPICSACGDDWPCEYMTALAPDEVNEADARAIRESPYSSYDLAPTFGVSISTIRQIRSGPSAPDEVNERATGVAAAADTAVSGRSEHRSPIWHVAPGTENESACAPDEANNDEAT